MTEMLIYIYDNSPLVFDPSSNSHLCLIPEFSFLSTTRSDALIVSLDFSHDVIHVQVTRVVHLHHHRRVFYPILQLLQLLFYQTTRAVSARGQNPEHGFIITNSQSGKVYLFINHLEEVELIFQRRKQGFQVHLRENPFIHILVEERKINQPFTASAICQKLFYYKFAKFRRTDCEVENETRM